MKPHARSAMIMVLGAVSVFEVLVRCKPTLDGHHGWPSTNRAATLALMIPRQYRSGYKDDLAVRRDLEALNLHTGGLSGPNGSGSRPAAGAAQLEGGFCRFYRKFGNRR